MNLTMKRSFRLFLRLLAIAVLLLLLVLIISAFVLKLNRRRPGGENLTPYLSHAEILYQDQDFQELSDYLDKNRLYQVDFDKYWEILRIRRQIALMAKLREDPSQKAQDYYDRILDQLNSGYSAFDPENQSMAQPWLKGFMP